MTLPLPCERGFYCPSGAASQQPCPAGTYGNMSGLIEEWQCSLCDAGMYCKEPGTIHPLTLYQLFITYMYRRYLSFSVFWCNPETIRGKWLLCYFSKGRTFPTGPCAAGFVCVGGAAEPSPLDRLTGFPCPLGFFCPLGTSVPEPCPKGTFRCLSCIMSVYYFIFLY